jgi:hypothetical protein
LVVGDLKKNRRKEDMSYSLVSVLKANANAGRPVSFNNNIILFKWDDVPVDPTRDASGVLITGDLTLDAGAVAIEMYATPKTIKAFDTSEGDPDKKGYIQHLEFEHPGDELAYAEFAENAINENWGAIVRVCDGSRTRLLGTKCCPLQFTHEQQSDSEAVTNVVKFASMLRGPKIAHYTGEIPVLDSDSGSGV